MVNDTCINNTRVNDTCINCVSGKRKPCNYGQSPAGFGQKKRAV